MVAEPPPPSPGKEKIKPPLSRSSLNSHPF